MNGPLGVRGEMGAEGVVRRKLTVSDRSEVYLSRHRAKTPGPCAADFNFNLPRKWLPERAPKVVNRLLRVVVGRKKAERDWERLVGDCPRRRRRIGRAWPGACATLRSQEVRGSGARTDRDVR